MNTKDQVITLKQAERLEELGVTQSSMFLWRKFSKSSILEIACNGTVVYESGSNDCTNESFGEIYAAYTLFELTKILRGYSPYWIAIWGEWGYKDTGGTPRGYENYTHACAECLTNLLENGKITAEEVNKRLTCRLLPLRLSMFFYRASCYAVCGVRRLFTSSAVIFPFSNRFVKHSAQAGELNIERSNPLGKYRYVKEDVIKALEKYSSKAA